MKSHSFLIHSRFRATCVAFAALAACVVLVVLASGCSQAAQEAASGDAAHNGNQKDIHNASIDAGIELVRHDGKTVRFPALISETKQQTKQSYQGLMLVGFIYTHCPGVCVTITQTMKRVSQLLSDEAGKTASQAASVLFVEITFDPERDSSAALWEYGRLHGLEHEMQSGSWVLLTGEQTRIDSLMKRYGIQTKRSYTEFNNLGEKVYFIDHTDRIALMNARGEVLHEYEISEVQPEGIVRDIQATRQ